MLAQDFAPLPERITFTVDVEDAAEGGDGLERCRAMVGRLLEFLALRDAVATFFVVGDVAERSPGLVREIAAAGHEIAGCVGQVQQKAGGDHGAGGRGYAASRSCSFLCSLRSSMFR
jgi:hypothetical protein